MSSSTVPAIKKFLANEEVNQKFLQTMDERKANLFKSSILQLVSNNTSWDGIQPGSIVSACLTAATLDLPINQNLGYAYIIPYKGKTMAAQFQMGYKGFIQLAQRSGLYKTINTSDVREGEIEFRDRLSGDISFQWEQDETKRLKLPVVGYVGYFELLSGFSKSLFMTKEEMEAHAKKYSQSYKANSSRMNIWKDDFGTMASKTIIKQLLSKYGPLSVEMKTALETDQAEVDSFSKDGMDIIKYVDNDGETEPEKDQRSEALKFIQDEAKTKEALNQVKPQLKSKEEKEAWEAKFWEFDEKESNAMVEDITIE